jgi:hypothetical protein
MDGAIAWPESISNQKNKTAPAIATIAAILPTIVIFVIRPVLNYYHRRLMGPIWGANRVDCRP